MNVQKVIPINEAFLSVPKQVHAFIDDRFYRIFGEGDKREVRIWVSATKQPKVTGKKRVAEILKAVDSFHQV